MRSQNSFSPCLIHQKLINYTPKEPLMSRTNIELDDKLVREGMRRTGLHTKRELVHRALESFVRKERLKSLLELRGKVKWEGSLKKMRRGRSWSL